MCMNIIGRSGACTCTYGGTRFYMVHRYYTPRIKTDYQRDEFFFFKRNQFLNIVYRKKIWVGAQDRLLAV